MRCFCTRWFLFAFTATLAWTLIGCGGDRGEFTNSPNRELADGATKNESTNDEVLAEEVPDEEFASEEFASEEFASEEVADFPDDGAWEASAGEDNEFPMTAAAPEFEPMPKSSAPRIPPIARPKIQSHNAPAMTRSYQSQSAGSYQSQSAGSQSQSAGSAPPPLQPAQPVAEKSSAAPAAPVNSIVGAPKRAAAGFTEVKVFYGTDRNRESITATSPDTLKAGVLATLALLICATGLLVFNRLKTSLAIGGLAGMLFVGLYWWQQDAPMRDGITYGIGRGSLVRGVSTVTVPKAHQRGMVERPSILRLEFKEDKNKHVVLAKATELNSDLFYQQMSQAVHGSDGDLLLFVHGFNVAFDEAIRRTAQIATDLSFEGVPVCYSWPSQGTLLGYTIDENNVIWTVPHLRDFLIELATKSQARSINIIAHSMGNRAVTSSLSQLSQQLPKNELPLVDQVVLAAPDVDADHFRNELAPRLAEVARQVTLYASSDDQALVASKHLHGGYPRAGESGENLVVVPEIETIDVSGIDLSLLGHNYYGSSESILRDLFEVVRRRLPADKRAGLISQRMKDTTYWMLARPRMSEKENAPIR